jgi:hypothetical protein
LVFFADFGAGTRSFKPVKDKSAASVTRRFFDEVATGVICSSATPVRVALREDRPDLCTGVL